jgi:hypothetical protein
MIAMMFASSVASTAFLRALLPQARVEESASNQTSPHIEQSL